MARTVFLDEVEPLIRNWLICQQGARLWVTPNLARGSPIRWPQCVQAASRGRAEESLQILLVALLSPASLFTLSLGAGGERVQLGFFFNSSGLFILSIPVSAEPGLCPVYMGLCGGAKSACGCPFVPSRSRHLGVGWVEGKAGLRIQIPGAVFRSNFRSTTPALKCL